MLYPNGTVVQLKQASKKLVIYGRKQLRLQDQIQYDYVGCLYPEGYCGPQTSVFFNHGDIAELIFKGYQDVDESAFQLKLSTYNRRGK